jgi:hypothetical protein
MISLTSIISTRISSLNATYDTLKTGLLGMANMCDGLPWPLKAVPQAILQLLKHAEVSLARQRQTAALTQCKDVRAARNQIITLLARVQSLWKAVAPLYGLTSPIPEPLQSGVQDFFNILLRTVVRLRIVQALHPVKTILAVASVQDILLEESQALEAARTVLQVQSYNTVLDFTHSALGSLRGGKCCGSGGDVHDGAGCW